MYTLAVRSDVGRQRANNEDAASVFTLPGAEAAFVVCDGMGGLRAGDIAAGEAVRVVEEALLVEFEQGNTEPIKALGEAFKRANDAVNLLQGPETAGEDDTEAVAGSVSPITRQEKKSGRKRLMGTTCVAGVVMGGVLHIAHTGDSRGYLLRRGHLTRLTEDHSFVAERVRAGDMTETEARTSRFRNIVTRAIGIDNKIEPEFRREPLEPGDMVLVCSDGLTTTLDDPEIAAAMNKPKMKKATPEQVAAQFVDMANAAGGPDNVTVMVLRVAGEAQNMGSAEIIDIDSPRVRPAKSPFLLYVALGILLTLAVLMGLFSFFAPFRKKVGELANPVPVVAPISGGNVVPIPTSATPVTSTVDFKRLKYDAPVGFGDFLARGDLLAYAPGQGLYFVAGSTGKIARLNPKGEAVISVGSLELVSAPDDVPSTHIFMTADPQGNVYISYSKRKVIEKIGADSKLLDVISGFSRPEAVAVDEHGNLFVVDFNEIKVCRAHYPKPKPSPSPKTGGNV